MLIKKKDFVPLQLCADQLFFSLQEFGHLFFISHLKSYFFFFILFFFLKKGKKKKKANILELVKQQCILTRDIYK